MAEDSPTEREAFFILNAIPGLGPAALARLLAEAGGDPRRVLLGTSGGSRIRNWRLHFDPVREMEQMERGGIDHLVPGDAAYPQLLREIHDPPVCLYRKGRYEFGHPCLAVIGTRRATQYGRMIARQLARGLAGRGYCIVSGLARGIDTAAHEGALEAGGRTVAVLGTGIDRVYPPENIGLFRHIAETGAVLSEFRLGSHATRMSFPMRNRIVSGMCAAVIVVESDVDGGAMTTARLAGEQGRTVFAVPGRVDQPTSAGCHQLIRDGAGLVTGLDDILSELGSLPPMRAPGASRSRARPVPDLTAHERAVLACLDGGEILAADAISGRTGLPAAALSSALLLLEIKGLAAKRLDGAYEACC